MPGWIGDTCSEFNTTTCGACVNGFCNGGAGCQCYPTWSGATCNVPVCTPGCLNGGTCNAATRTCSCPSGWTGNDCGTSVCPTPCMNGGTCSNGGTTTAATCTCPAPFTGATCSQVDCGISDACKNGATCSAGVCSCASGIQTILILSLIKIQCSASSLFSHLIGWAGILCDQPVCSEGCRNTTGSCTVPNTCICADGNIHFTMHSFDSEPSPFTRYTSFVLLHRLDWE